MTFSPYEVRLAVKLERGVPPTDLAKDEELYDPFGYLNDYRGTRFLVRLKRVRIETQGMAEALARRPIQPWRIHPAFARILQEEGNERTFVSDGLRCVIHRDYWDGRLHGCVELPSDHPLTQYVSGNRDEVCGHPRCTLHALDECIEGVHRFDTDHWYDVTGRLPVFAESAAAIGSHAFRPVIVEAYGTTPMNWPEAVYQTMTDLTGSVKGIARLISEFNMEAFLARKEAT